MSRLIKVLLADEQTLVRAGVVRLLSESPDIDVVGEVDTGPLLQQHIGRSVLDVVVLDIDMENLSGVDLIAEVKKVHGAPKVIVLTRHESELLVSRSFDAGADAYLSKCCAFDELVTAIHEVMNDGQYLSNGISRHIALNKVSNEERAVMSLTGREFTVFRFLAQGQSMTEIADLLHISPKTGYVFRSRIFEKLKTKNIVELTKIAHRHRVV